MSTVSASSSVVVVSVAGAYLLASLLLGVLAGRNSSDSAAGYVAGDRSLGLVVMYFITGATIFSAFAFLGAPGWTYSRGVAACYILGYGTLGMLPLYFLGPRAARLGRRFGFVTQGEMLAARYRAPSLAAIAAVISIVAFVPYLALQMKGAGYVLEVVTSGRLPQWAGAAMVYAVVLVYVLRSGVLGVGWTNTFQGVFMLAMAWGLGIYLPRRLYGGLVPMFSRIADARPGLLVPPGLDKQGAPWNWAGYSSDVWVSIVGFSMWPHLFMKAFSARDDDTIRRTVVLYPTFQLFLVPLFLIGFSGVLFPSAPARPDEIVPHMLMRLELPSLVVGLFCAGALAASMSSGDAMVHAAASIWVRDFVAAGLGRRLAPERERSAIRRAVVLLMVAAYGVAVLYEGSLVVLLLAAYGAVVQFAPAVVLALYVRRVRSQAVIAALVVGALVTVVLTAVPELRPWPLHAGLYGLIVNAALLALGNRDGAQPDAAVDAFVDCAAGRAAGGPANPLHATRQGGQQ